MGDVYHSPVMGRSLTGELQTYKDPDGFLNSRTNKAAYLADALIALWHGEVRRAIEKKMLLDVGIQCQRQGIEAEWLSGTATLEEDEEQTRLNTW